MNFLMIALMADGAMDPLEFLLRVATNRNFELPSPTDSGSSGFFSNWSSKSSDDSASVVSYPPTTEITCSSPLPTSPCVCSPTKTKTLREPSSDEFWTVPITKVQVKEKYVPRAAHHIGQLKKINLKLQEKRVDYNFQDRRDILDLGNNVTPLSWQLRSPLTHYLNPYKFIKDRELRFQGDAGLIEDYPMSTCGMCDFQELAQVTRQPFLNEEFATENQRNQIEELLCEEERPTKHYANCGACGSQGTGQSFFDRMIIMENQRIEIEKILQEEKSPTKSSSSSEVSESEKSVETSTPFFKDITKNLQIQTEELVKEKENSSESL